MMKNLKHLKEYNETSEDYVTKTATVYILRIENSGMGELHVHKEELKADDPELKDYIADADGDLNNAIILYFKDPEVISSLYGHHSIVLPLTEEQYGKLKMATKY